MNVVVIADDLTGAAELAGAAADLGFTAEVQLHFDPTSDAQVVAVDTRSRTMKPEAGVRLVEEITGKIVQSRPRWIYKKTDSVLRGNVREEIEVILNATGLERALFVPANPSKNRIICHGVYYVNGVPLAETSFANDPHHPRTSSKVIELLGESDVIDMPDVEQPSTLRKGALRLNDKTLPAGGVEFFRVVLQRRMGTMPTAPSDPALNPPVLFVCGSPQACSDGRLEQFAAAGIPVFPMPESLRSNISAPLDLVDRWVDEVMSSICATGRAAIAIGELPTCNCPPMITRYLIDAAEEAITRGSLSTICIEGGETAAQLLLMVSCNRLTALPGRSYPGAALLRSSQHPGVTFVVKPGSYPWPESVLSIPV